MMGWDKKDQRYMMLYKCEVTQVASQEAIQVYTMAATEKDIQQMTEEQNQLTTRPLPQQLSPALESVIMEN